MNYLESDTLAWLFYQTDKLNSRGSMETVAILAPPVDGLTPQQVHRAQQAMMQQMLLIAQGYPSDHPAVRNAAAVVGSAISPDPVELELAQLQEAKPREDRVAPSTRSERERSEAYGRYLKTIFSTQPT